MALKVGKPSFFFFFYSVSSGGVGHLNNRPDDGESIYRFKRNYKGAQAPADPSASTELWY